MQPFWQTLTAHLQAGRRVFLALVVAHEDHSPGTAGAKLLVAEDGTLDGSVGGGIMEYNIVQRARQVLAQETPFKPEIRPLNHRPEGRGEPSGLVCAGSQTNLYYLCTPEEDGAALAQAAALVEADWPGVLTMRPSGITVEEGILTQGRPAVSFTQAEVGWRYEEDLLNRNRLAILGGGHCSLALSQQMRLLGYHVQVFDTRPEVSSFTGNPYAHSIIHLDDYRGAAARISFPEYTSVVLMTNEFQADVQGLLGMLPLPVPYIGLMGSHAKIGRVFTALRKAGVSKETFTCVTAPVGLPIESDTPEEIAVSVAAQLIRLKRKGEV